MSDAERSLGLEKEIDLFPDGKKRKLYPQSMRSFFAFMKHIAAVDLKKLWVNYLYTEENEDSPLTLVMEMSFRDEDPDDLLEVINPANYPDIMKEIVKINQMDDLLKTEKNVEEV